VVAPAGEDDRRARHGIGDDERVEVEHLADEVCGHDVAGCAVGDHAA